MICVYNKCEATSLILTNRIVKIVRECKCQPHANRQSYTVFFYGKIKVNGETNACPVAWGLRFAFPPCALMGRLFMHDILAILNKDTQTE